MQKGKDVGADASRKVPPQARGARSQLWRQRHGRAGSHSPPHPAPAPVPEAASPQCRNHRRVGLRLPGAQSEQIWGPEVSLVSTCMERFPFGQDPCLVSFPSNPQTITPMTCTCWWFYSTARKGLLFSPGGLIWVFNNRKHAQGKRLPSTTSS